MKTKVCIMILLVLVGTVNIAFAAWSSLGDNLQYNLDVGILYIKGEGEMVQMSHYPWEDKKDQILTVEVEEGVTSLGNAAFFQFTELRTVRLPEGLEKIGANCFQWCSALANISIPQSVKEIGSNAFGRCTSLIRISIPENVTAIPYNTFLGCTMLEEVTVPDSVREIGKKAFSGCAITEIHLPSQLTMVSPQLFEGCQSLQSIEIPEGVTVIEERAFWGCKSLASITLPGTLLDLGNGAFGYTAISSVLLPESLYRIQNNAFQNCGGLSAVTIPTNCGLGSFSFGSCAELKTVFFKGKLSSIAMNAFHKSEKVTFFGPSGSNAEKYAAENNIPFVSIDEMDIISLPADCTVIESKAFAGLGDSDKIRVVCLTEKVAVIEEDAFADSKVYFSCPAGSYAETWAEKHDIPIL